MRPIEEIAPNFKRAADRWPDAPNLSAAYKSLDEKCNGSPHGLFEHCKSFLESVCLTILVETKTAVPAGDPPTTQLVRESLKALGLENQRGASHFDSVLSAYNKLADALTEVRNQAGPVAHGKEGFLDAITEDYYRAALHTTDALIGVLLNAYDGIEPDLTVTREPYRRFSHLHERIDNRTSITAEIDEDRLRPTISFSIPGRPEDEPITLRIAPSELLFALDRDAYVELLRTVSELPEPAEDEIESEPVEPEPLPEKPVITPSVDAPQLVFAIEFGGDTGVPPLVIEELLTAKGVDISAELATGEKLLPSILSTINANVSLDWQVRPQLLAKQRVAVSRLLRVFKLDNVEQLASDIVKLFEKQV